jgi:murein tripeptide amidase MpaA
MYLFRVITIIVPMINPDGVILGNSRTGAIGKDLNR